MQKYLKITHEDFRKACEISHRVRNSFSSVFGFIRLAKFCTRWEIHFSQSCSLSCSLYSFWHLACYAKLLDVRFLLWFSSLHTWLIWQRLRSSPKLGFFMCLSFNLLGHGLYKILHHSWLVLMIKKLSKMPKLAKNWLETFARVFNVPIELKGNKYYSKVFKRVYNKL